MSINRAEKSTIWTVALTTIAYVLLGENRQSFDRLLHPLSGPAAHMLLEAVAFSLCMAILAIGWMVNVATLCSRRLSIAALFAFVGAIDLLEGLSSQGIPLYGPDKGAALAAVLGWIAQFGCAIGMIAVFSLRNRQVSPRARRIAALLAIAALGLAAGFVFGVFDPSSAVNARLRMALNAAVLLLDAGAAWIVLYRNREERPQAMLTIFKAIVWLIFAKAVCMLGTKPDDSFALTADAFKLIGYYFVLQGTSLVMIEEPSKQRKQKELKLSELAYRDELTGLPNRRKFTELVLDEQARAEAARAAGRSNSFAVLWLDLNRFKTINDSLGHSFGDLLLKQVAARLADCAGPDERVSRMSGDEFTILLTGLSGAEEAGIRAQQVIDRFVDPVKVGLTSYHLNVSAGLALYPDDGRTVERLLQNADTAMYGAKSAQNAWMRYEPSMNDKAKERLLLENELRIALEQNQFRLDYQPLIDLELDKLVGAEALVRWDHPKKGRIPPSEFIPLCEENGFIILLGEWVLRTACQQAAQWITDGHPPLILAVNLSIRQFRQHDLCDRVRRALEDAGLPAQLLELEITESIMADAVHATSMLEQLKKLGVRISIDDFGTGYSSLNYLKKFPIDKLKIDRSFVNDVLSDRNDAAIVSGISSMARSLNLTVTAEGVETEEQVAFLREQQCREAQGFFFSRPVSPEQFSQLFRREPLSKRNFASL